MKFYIACILLLVGCATWPLVKSMSLYLEEESSSKEHEMRNDAWNDLKVTWGLNPFSPDVFVSMPRTEVDAIKQGWTKEKGCGQVNGNRYMFTGDRAVLLIFDANGDIAGISSALPKGLPFNFPSNDIKKLFKDEGDSYTINAYFTDPSKVCTPSSTRKPTGDRLIIDGTQYQLNVPMLESDVDEFWTLGQCFRTMGVHYWADISGRKLGEDSLADHFVPMFLQYNKGRLNGFGWGFNADVTSRRFEHPTPSILGSFFKEVPKFMSDPTQTGVLSTLHIYLDSTPQLNFC